MPNTMLRRSLPLWPLPLGWTNGWGGEYYQGMGYDLSSSFALAADTIYAGPMLIPAGTSFDLVGFRSETGGDGTVRLGLYNSDPFTGLPSSLLTDFGTVTVLGGGAKTITISPVLEITETALYWLACQRESAAVPRSKSMHGAGLLWAGDPATRVAWGYSKGGQGTGFADPFPASPSLVTGTDGGPLIYMRVLAPPPVPSVAKRHRRLQVCWGAEGEDVIMMQDWTALDSNVSQPANRLDVQPFPLQAPARITSIRAAVGTGTPSGTVVFAVYASNEDGYPERLIWQGPSQDLSLGINAQNPDLLLGPGLYWVGVATSSPVSVAWASRRGDGISQASLTTAAGTSSYPISCLRATITDGPTAPDPFPTGASGITAQYMRVEVENVIEPPYGERPYQAPNAANVYVVQHNYLPSAPVGPCATSMVINQPFNTEIVDSAYAQPFMLDRPMTFDQAWVHIRSISVGGTATIEMGIYEADDSSLSPGRLRYKVTGTVNAAGVARFSVDWPLSPGLYFLAYAGTGVVSLGGYTCNAVAWRYVPRVYTVRNEPAGALLAAVGTLPDPAAFNAMPQRPIRMGLRVGGYGGY